MRSGYLVKAYQKELAPGNDKDDKDKGYPASIQEHENGTHTSSMSSPQTVKGNQQAASCSCSHQYSSDPGARLDIVYLLKVMPCTLCVRAPFV